jgi:4-hydroxy-2-oxoglutarate aldolase
LQIFDLAAAGMVKEAQQAQLKLAKMEWGFATAGINGTKWVVAKLLGYPEGCCHCRRPYPKYEDKSKQESVLDIVAPFLETEKSLKSWRAPKSSAS